MSTKEEIIKKLLKNILDDRLKRLERREMEQRKDLKLAKDAYHKQGILVKKLCSVKIEIKKPVKRNRTVDKLSRRREPNTVSRRNLPIFDKDKNKRSKTPNIIMRKKKTEPKEKNENARKSKTPLKSIKKGHNSNTTKIPSNMGGTSSNLNKNKKFGNKTNLKSKRSITPDAKIKSKTNNGKKLVKSTNVNHDKDLKLIDIKPEDMNEYVPIEEKKSEKEKEEVKIPLFELLIDNNKIINNLSLFMDEGTQYNFFSCNKKLTKYLNEKLMTSIETLKSKNNISSSSTIQDQINAIKLKYKKEELTTEPEFSLSRATVKAIEMLNSDVYNKIFRNKEDYPTLFEIILIYRIFFQLLKDSNLNSIKDDKLFWAEVSDYILKNNNGSTGEFFKNSIKNFDFSAKNLYEVKKLVSGHEDKIKPSAVSKICQTTGLIIFMIKDTLEYVGIIDSKKSVPALKLKVLEYIGELQTKIESYIENIRKINNRV